MSDAVVLVVLAVVFAAAGIGAGILIGRPLDRFVSRDDDADAEDADGPSSRGSAGDGS